MRKLALDGVRRGRRAKAVGGHFILFEAKQAQGRVDRVFTHATRRRADGWKEELPTAGYCAQFSQDGDCLRRQRNAMRALHFHFSSRNRPNASFQVEFCPFSRAKLAGAHEGEGEQVSCALMLTRYRRHSGSLTRAAFLSARNDALANVAVIAAGLLTAYASSALPDLIVGLGIAEMNADEKYS
jgi:hypothetical protein